VVTVSECASHAAVLAAMGPAAGGKGTGEQSLARRLLPRLEEDWLLLADRNFYSFGDWCTAADTGAALLWRVRSSLGLPVLEVLPDGSWRSVLISRRVDPRRAARARLLAAAGRGEDLDEDQARYVRVIEYQVPDRDGNGQDERIILVTTITDARLGPGAGPGAGLPPAVGARDRERPAENLSARPGQGAALAVPGHGGAGDLGLPADPLRHQRADLHRSDERRDRPGPGQVPADRPDHPPPGR
jgi:hypothetical protein